jgi:hypothetical protein
MTKDSKTEPIDLSHWTGGGSAITRFSCLFRTVYATGGALDFAGQAGAFWLLDLIASHQPGIYAKHGPQDFQLWRVVRLPEGAKHDARAECWTDTPGAPGSVRLAQQLIPMTDFPFDRLPANFRLYLEGDARRQAVILLPCEH